MSSSMSDALEYRQLRAPRQHGGTLVDPPFRDIPTLVERNAASLASLKYDVQGCEWSQLREEARAEVQAAARTYTSSYLSLPTCAGGAPVSRMLVAGHQPELFHPGVWYKNFALDQLSEQLGGETAGIVPLNLVVDNDLARATSIRAPAQGTHGPYLARVPLDQAGGDIPYEQRRVLDAALFESFPLRVRQVLRPFELDPLVTKLWPMVREAAARTQNMGLALAQARHQMEARWGSHTLELPISTMADTRTFRWFACHLLAHLPRLHRHYNQALHDYRVAHGLRSRSHPVADLDEHQGWLEAPLWMWSDAEPWRRPVFARASGDELEVTDRRHVLLRWPIKEEGSAERGVESWGEARRRGIRIRPRALTTTMFSRLACSDLFLHGIGGAKYDQLTDEIIRRFFGADPPGYMTLSATILLPVPREDVTPDDLRRLERLLRELRFHPEKHAPTSGVVQALAEQKQDWIARQVPADARKERHRAIERVNQALQPMVEPIRQQLRNELQDLKERLRVTSILASREFSFCLFPEANLRSMLSDLLHEQD